MTTADPERAARPARAPLGPTLLVGATLVVPLLVLAVAAGRQSWWPVHDFALIELRVRDVGGADTPLVGAYSRFGWSHPGPLAFLVLAPLYRLAGSAPAALLAGAALLNAAAVAGSLAVARRRGGMVLVGAVAVLLALLLHALGTDIVASPWNAWLVVLPTVLLGLLAWSWACGDVRAAPFAVLVASFLVQTHLGVAPVALAVLAVAVVGYVLERRAHPTKGSTTDDPTDDPTDDNPTTDGPTDDDPTTDDPTDDPPAPDGWLAADRGWLLAALVVGIVVWLPPLVDQLSGTGNLASIVRFFTGAQPDHPPTRTALGVAANELGPLGPWLRGTGAEPLVPFAGTLEPGPVAALLVPFGALAVAAVVTRVRRDRDGWWLVLVAGAAAAATVIALLRMSDAVWDYVVRWSWAVGLLVWLAVGRAIGQPLLARLPAVSAPARARRAWVGAAVAAVVVAVVLLPAPGLTAPEVPEAKAGAPVGDVADAVLAGLGDPGGPVLVRPVDSEVRFPLPSSRQPAAGLAAVLERAGISTRVVEDDWRPGSGGGGSELFGAHRLADGTEAGTLLVAAGPTLDTYRPPPGAVEVGRSEDAAEVAELRRLERDLTERFTAAGHPDAAALVPDAAVAWVPFNFPDLASSLDDVERLIELRDERRLAVWWLPTDAG